MSTLTVFLTMHERLPPDPQRDQDGHDGVGVVPAGQVDDQAAEHDAQAGGRVADQVQEGAAQVEVVAVGAEQQGGHPVDHQAGRPRSRPPTGPRPSCGRQHAADGLDDDVDRDGDQHGGVEHGHQDLGPLVGEGAAGGGGPPAEADRPETQAQGDDVAQVVGGVGQQAQAVGEDAADHLQQRDEQVERQADDQPRVGGRGNRVPARAACAVRAGMPACAAPCRRAWAERPSGHDDLLAHPECPAPLAEGLCRRRPGSSRSCRAPRARPGRGRGAASWPPRRALRGGGSAARAACRSPGCSGRPCPPGSRSPGSASPPTTPYSGTAGDGLRPLDQPRDSRGWPQPTIITSPLPSTLTSRACSAMGPISQMARVMGPVLATPSASLRGPVTTSTVAEGWVILRGHVGGLAGEIHRSWAESEKVRRCISLDAAHVIEVAMGDEDRVDVGRRDAERLHVAQQGRRVLLAARCGPRRRGSSCRRR